MLINVSSIRPYFVSLIIITLLTLSNLVSSEPLHISLGDNYGKHAMLKAGKPAGIQKELLTWFFKEYAGIEVSLEAMPWKRAQRLVVEQKQSDGYFTAYTDFRVNTLKLMPSVIPFYTTAVKMHTWKGNPKLTLLRSLSSLDALLAEKELRFVIQQGHGYSEEHFGQAEQIHRVSSPSQIPLFLLKYHRADIFVEQSELFYPLAEEANLKDQIVTLNNIQFQELNWHLFIRPDSIHRGRLKEINALLIQAKQDGSLDNKVKEIFKSYDLEY